MPTTPRDHQLMTVRLSKALTRETAIMIAKTYDLSASVQDNIAGNTPGLTLISALEQRLIISRDERILNGFCQTLFDLELDDAAAIMKKVYPKLIAKQNNPTKATVVPPKSEVRIPGSMQNGQQPGEPQPASTDVNDATLSKLSECIGAEWKQIALESLKLKKFVLDQIEADFPRATGRSLEIFVRWRKRNIGHASPQDLLTLLKAREDVDEDAINVLEKECKKPTSV